VKPGVEDLKECSYQTGLYGNLLSVMTETTMVRPRRGRPRDPAADRAILESARAVLARRGFTGTSMEEIARNSGTLYGADVVAACLKIFNEQSFEFPN